MVEAIPFCRKKIYKFIIRFDENIASTNTTHATKILWIAL